VIMYYVNTGWASLPTSQLQWLVVGGTKAKLSDHVPCEYWLGLVADIAAAVVGCRRDKG